MTTAQINLVSIAGRKSVRRVAATSVTGICYRVLNVDGRGVRGGCGPAAIALNRALFGGKGRYLVMADRQLLVKHRRWVGHVMVQYQGQLYDAAGEFSYRDYTDWIQTVGESTREGTDSFYSDLPRMREPRDRVATMHSNVACFWATEAQVRRAFLGESPMLERLFVYMSENPRVALSPRHRTRFDDPLLQERYGWVSKAERQRRGLRRLRKLRELRELRKLRKGSKRKRKPLKRNKRHQILRKAAARASARGDR